MSLRPLAFSMLRTHLLACSFNHQKPACTFLAYCFFHAWATFESDEAGTSTRRTRSRASLGEAPTVHRFSSPEAIRAGSRGGEGGGGEDGGGEGGGGKLPSRMSPHPRGRRRSRRHAPAAEKSPPCANDQP